MAADALPVFATALALGLIHGAEPGHGWPIAATYALDRERTWLTGFAASALLGLGHLVSSLAVVGAFFLTKTYFELSALNEPIVVEGVAVGGPLGVVAGVLLIALGVREYRRRGRHGGPADGHGQGDLHGTAGHDQTHGHDHQGDHHDHGGHHHDDHEHAHDGSPDRGPLGRIRTALPFLGGDAHSHPSADDLDRTGLAGLVWTAVLLGFVHEEEFEIIGLCLGSTYCLSLMVVYAVAVLVSLVGLTMLLVAGYERYEERVEGLVPYFPIASAAVLVGMGLAFALGLV